MRSLAVVTAVFVLAVVGHAQTMHIPPLRQPPFSRHDTLLLVQLARPGSADHVLADSSVSFRISDNTLYVMTLDTLQSIELGDRTIAQLIDHLRAKYPAARFFSSYPELSTSDLAEGSFSATGDHIVVTGRVNQPSVQPEAGIGFSLADAGERSGSTQLLQNAGVHLDLVGSKPFGFGTLRIRLGFRTSEAVALRDPDGADSVGGSPPRSVGTFVESAQLLVVGIHADLPVWQAATENALVSWGYELSQSWAAFDPFVFDSIAVEGIKKSVEELAPPREFARLRDAMDRVRPVRTMVTGPRIVLGTRDENSFYLLSDIGITERYERSFRVIYGTDPSNTEEFLTLRGTIRSSPIWIVRLGTGLTFRKTINLRVDAVTPWRDTRDEYPPLLRLVLSAGELSFE